MNTSKQNQLSRLFFLESGAEKRDSLPVPRPPLPSTSHYPLSLGGTVAKWRDDPELREARFGGDLRGHERYCAFRREAGEVLRPLMCAEKNKIEKKKKELETAACVRAYFFSSQC